MRAVEYQGLRALSLVEVRRAPVLPAGWVRVRVRACGLCGSDIAKWTKAEPMPGYLKTRILGHEVVGEVTECGVNASRLHPGMRVAVEPLFVCGECAACVSGCSEFCGKSKALGRDLPGGFSEEIIAPEKFVWALSKNIPDDAGTLLDPLSVVVHGFHLSGLKPAGLQVAVVGDGPLGLLSVAYAKSQGAQQVILFGRHSSRLAAGKKLGADAVFNTAAGELLPQDRRNKFGLVIEAAGGRQSATLDLAISCAASSSTLLVFGVFEAGFCAPLPVRDLFSREIRMIGVNSFARTAERSDFGTALDFLEKELDSLSCLITHSIALGSMESIFELVENMDKNGLIKAVIKV